MPGYDNAVSSSTRDKVLYSRFDEAEAAESTAGASEELATEAMGATEATGALNQSATAGTVSRAANPIISASLMMAERTLIDANASVRAREETPQQWEKSIERLSKRGRALDMEPAHAMAMLTDAKLRNSLDALATMSKELPAEINPAFDKILEGGRQELNTVLRSPTLSESSVASSMLPVAGAADDQSMNAFFGNIGKAIDSLKENYLGVYEDGMQKNSAFYKEFLEATDLSKWMKTNDKNVILDLQLPGEALPDLTPEQIEAAFNSRAGIDGHYERTGSGITGLVWVKHTRVKIIENVLKEHKVKQAERLVLIKNGAGLMGSLKALLEKFEPKSASDEKGIFIKAKDEETAKKWAKDMGLPASVVMASKDAPPKPGEEWWVTLDLEPVKNIIKSLEAMAKKYNAREDAGGKIVATIPTAEFQAWKVGYEAQATEIKNIATAMAQKMANAQSIYENLIKVLTNTINSIMDMLKNFL